MEQEHVRTDTAQRVEDAFGRTVRDSLGFTEPRHRLLLKSTSPQCKLTSQDAHVIYDAIRVTKREREQNEVSTCDFISSVLGMQHGDVVYSVLNRGGYGLVLEIRNEHDTRQRILKLCRLKDAQGDRQRVVYFTGDKVWRPMDDVDFGYEVRMHKAIYALYKTHKLHPSTKVPELVTADIKHVRGVRIGYLEEGRVHGVELGALLASREGGMVGKRQLVMNLGYTLGGLHKANVIHGDLHPSNVMVDGKEVYVIDFARSVLVSAIPRHLLQKAVYYDVYVAIRGIHAAYYPATEAAYVHILKDFFDSYWKARGGSHDWERWKPCSVVRVRAQLKLGEFKKSFSRDEGRARFTDYADHVLDFAVRNTKKIKSEV